MLEGGGRLLPHGGDMTHQQTDVGGGVGGCCHMCEEDGETWGGGLTNGHGETMGGTSASNVLDSLTLGILKKFF